MKSLPNKDILTALSFYTKGALDARINDESITKVLLQIKTKIDEIIFSITEDNEEIQAIIPNKPNYSNILIEDLNLTGRTTNCLIAENILNVSRLIQCSVSDLFKIPNLGRKSLKEIEDKLKELGLSLSKTNFLFSKENPWKYQ